MELESELMLQGNWKNFEELEDSLSYPELEAMVEASRNRDYRMMKFQAAMQGVDLDKDKPQEEDPVEKIKRRLRAEQMGKTEEEVRFADTCFAAGFAVEVE